MTDGSAMLVLSLVEAAEQTATSKIDIWRAIQEGALPAQKNRDGAYAINPCDLFRVFEKRKPDSGLPLSQQEAAPESAGAARTDEAPEAAASKEILVAFEALQAELQSLLRSPGKGAPNGEDKRQGEHEERAGESGESSARFAADLDDRKAKAGIVADFRAGGGGQDRGAGRIAPLVVAPSRALSRNEVMKRSDTQSAPKVPVRTASTAWKDLTVSPLKAVTEPPCHAGGRLRAGAKSI